MFRRIMNFLRSPNAPKFLDAPTFPVTDPEQAKRDARVATLRAQIERESAHFASEQHHNCKQYGEHVIGQLSRNEITLSCAFALIHSYASRQAHRLAPQVSLTAVKG